jgi:hypothetical protein
VQEFQMLQRVSLSILRTWRLTTDGGLAAVDTDLTGYRSRIDRAKSINPPTYEYSLPWPTYSSKLWQNYLGSEYKNMKTRDLVAALVPLQVKGNVSIEVEGVYPDAEVEAFWHPFAITAVLHLYLKDIVPWPAAPDAASFFDSLIRQRIGGAQKRQLRDGPALEWLPPGPQTDADGRATEYRSAMPSMFISGLHQKSDSPGALAFALASLFLKEGEAEGVPMMTAGSAVAASGRNTAVLLPFTLPTAGYRLGCLHHNLTTLWAIMQNLLTLPGADATESCRWFKSRAAIILTQLYHRSPLPFTGTVYKSRLPELWISRSGLASQINAVAAQSGTQQLSPIPVS